jgi:K+-transporting ATPase ATPase A chain
MHHVYAGRPRTRLDRIFGWLEERLYKLCGIDSREEMSWRQYATAVLVFSAAGTLAVYLLQLTQAWLPLNPRGLGNVEPGLAFNTAMSFATNTNWQNYGGETTLSYLTQMLALGVQNFVSAAAGMAVLAAFARGLARRGADTLGNFWVDLTRTTLYILLPLSLVFALFLVSQGVVQSFSDYRVIHTLEGKSQVLPLGPAASQIAIKQLGTNGGGFFNVNSAHPFENPTPLSNFAELVAILLIPTALCFTYGRLVKDSRQGWALLAAMAILFLPALALCYGAERHAAPGLSNLGIDAAASELQCGGNMEGKEARFGIVHSALWATATTAASNGSVNSMHDSFMPLGGLSAMWMMMLGEVSFGGVGSGLYGMLAFVIIAVFVAGLMVGRTPEYLGKKVEPFEMKMATLVVLIPAALVLAGTALATLLPTGKGAASNPGPHGFSEILYAFTSASNNNGSAFAGLGANNTLYNSALGACMFFGRFFVMVPILAIAGSMAVKRKTPPSAGTLPTHTPVFIGMLTATVVIVGALTYVPALALGPIAEHLQMATASVK